MTNEGMPAQAVVARTIDERKAILAQNIANFVGQGYRIESQSDTMAVLVVGRRVNHLLHFFIGIFTLGIWWIVWLIMAIAGGERRRMMTVDEFGNVLVQKA
jgi:hypothetical protein